MEKSSMSHSLDGSHIRYHWQQMEVDLRKRVEATLGNSATPPTPLRSDPLLDSIMTTFESVSALFPLEWHAARRREQEEAEENEQVPGSIPSVTSGDSVLEPSGDSVLDRMQLDETLLLPSSSLSLPSNSNDGFRVPATPLPRQSALGTGMAGSTIATPSTPAPTTPSTPKPSSAKNVSFYFGGSQTTTPGKSGGAGAPGKSCPPSPYYPPSTPVPTMLNLKAIVDEDFVLSQRHANAMASSRKHRLPKGEEDDEYDDDDEDGFESNTDDMLDYLEQLVNEERDEPSSDLAETNEKEPPPSSSEEEIIDLSQPSPDIEEVVFDLSGEPSETKSEVTAVASTTIDPPSATMPNTPLAPTPQNRIYDHLRRKLGMHAVPSVESPLSQEQQPRSFVSSLSAMWSPVRQGKEEDALERPAFFHSPPRPYSPTHSEPQSAIPSCLPTLPPSISVALYRRHEPPPTTRALLSSLHQYGLPEVEEQGPFFSNPLDVPKLPKVYAGREIRILANSVPYLKEFESSWAADGEGNTQVSDWNLSQGYGVAVDFVSRQTRYAF